MPEAPMPRAWSGTKNVCLHNKRKMPPKTAQTGTTSVDREAALALAVKVEQLEKRLELLERLVVPAPAAPVAPVVAPVAPVAPAPSAADPVSTPLAPLAPLHPMRRIRTVF
jgi:hypothetical protein